MEKSGMLEEVLRQQEANATPVLEMPSMSPLPHSLNCISCSEDAKYLALGFTRSLAVWCTQSHNRITGWRHARIEIIQTQMTKLGGNTYLISCVDDMGVARLFAFRHESIFLLNVINMMEDVNRRSICWTFDVFPGGSYATGSFSCNDSAWLEIYQFPAAAWTTEAELPNTPLSGRTSASSVSIGPKWSPIAVLSKIFPPQLQGGKPQDADYFKYCLAVDEVWGGTSQRIVNTTELDIVKSRDSLEKTRRCTHHFLLNCEPFATEPSDLNPWIEVMWPNANEILCSAVSKCTCFIALGLEEAIVSIWNRKTSAPFSVISLPDNGPLFRLEFFDSWPVSALKTSLLETVHLLVMSRSGILHTTSAARETLPTTEQLNERPTEGNDLTSTAITMPCLQGLILIILKSGKMFIQDVISKATVCFLTPPPTFVFGSPWSPVFVLNTKHATLFIPGHPETECGKKPSQNRLLAYSFEDSELMKDYALPEETAPLKPVVKNHETVEEICNLYLEQRMPEDERNQILTKTLGQLQDAAVALQRQRSTSQMKNYKKCFKNILLQ